MNIQSSFKNEKDARLYIVPTPIGNMEDITFRALRILKEVDLIAAEDTRHTGKLLNYFDIKNTMVSYYEHNRQERTPQLLQSLYEGKQIALVSDAGMPGISDPGLQLIQETIKKQYPVIVLPGANAALCALVGSGLDTSSFYFYGFLPRKKGDQKKALQKLINESATLLFYESPYRVKQTVDILGEVLGNRKVALARELTKVYEQYIRGSIEEVSTWLKQNPIKGECVIVVEGTTSTNNVTAHLWWQTLTIDEHVAYYEREKKLPHKEAMRLTANDRNISRRDVYRALHVDR